MKQKILDNVKAFIEIANENGIKSPEISISDILFESNWINKLIKPPGSFLVILVKYVPLLIFC